MTPTDKTWIILFTLSQIGQWVLILWLFNERRIRRWTVKTRKFYNDFKKGRTK